MCGKLVIHGIGFPYGERRRGPWSWLNRLLRGSGHSGGNWNDMI